MVLLVEDIFLTLVFVAYVVDNTKSTFDTIRSGDEMFRATKAAVEPFSTDDYEAMAVKKHPVTVDQVVLAINGRLASGDFSNDCWEVLRLPYWFGEAEMKEAVVLFEAAGWRSVGIQRRFALDKEEEMRDWEFRFLPHF